VGYNYKTKRIYALHTISVPSSYGIFVHKLEASIVFQTKCEFLFAWLLRRRWCKSNVISRSCYLGILMHRKWQRVAFCISLPHPAIFELPLPVLFSPASRTSHAPYFRGLPPPCRPHTVSMADRRNKVCSLCLPLFLSVSIPVGQHDVRSGIAFDWSLMWVLVVLFRLHDIKLWLESFDKFPPFCCHVGSLELIRSSPNLNSI